VARILVIHYEPAEAALLAERVRRQGFDAEAYPCVGAKGFRAIREYPPDAILIDLFRMPSYGKAMGALLREHKGTRAIPLVFLEGDPEKAAAVRQVLPDAAYAPLPRIGAALRRAIARPPADPLLPQVNTSILRKLHIGPESKVALVNAPEGFQLPAEAQIVRKTEAADVVLTFAGSRAVLGREMPRIAKGIGAGRFFWIAWQKKQPVSLLPAIHESCQAFGLVAYKTCALDAIWSAAVVARRAAR
jgi:CheY-like chemotaxis protein